MRDTGRFTPPFDERRRVIEDRNVEDDLAVELARRANLRIRTAELHRDAHEPLPQMSASQDAFAGLMSAFPTAVSDSELQRCGSSTKRRHRSIPSSNCGRSHWRRDWRPWQFILSTAWQQTVEPARESWIRVNSMTGRVVANPIPDPQHDLG
jgi:hypothetical protein